MKRHALWLFVAITFVLVGVLWGAPARMPTPTPTPTPVPKIKVKQVAVTTPTPSAAPKKINVVRTDKGTPTPTPKAITRSYPPPPPATPTPARIPKDTVVKTPPDAKKLVPEPTKSPRDTVTTTKDITAPPPSSKRLIPATTNLSPAPVPNSAPPSPPASTPPPSAPVNHTLRIFTKNGKGTTSTSLSGEFPVQLDVYANVAKDFALQWGRDNAGTEEKGNLYITKVSSTSWLGAKPVTMPPTAKGTNIEYSIPNLAPGTYELLVAGDKGNSNRVTVNFSGATSTGNGDVTLPTPSESQPPAGPGYKLRLAEFKPMVGTKKGQPDYHAAELRFEIAINGAVHINDLRFEVDSKPFTNSEVLTASDSPHSPIQLLSGKYSGKGDFPMGKSGTHLVHLKPTNDFTKEGPGISTPADWSIAYDKTDVATFKWFVNGQYAGSVEMPLHKDWNFPPWKEKDYQLPPAPKGPIKPPGKK
jgi:hypothetical protein